MELEKAKRCCNLYINSFDSEADKCKLTKAIETVLQELDNNISKDKVKEEKEIAQKEYQKILNSIDRKISHTKDEHKIRSIYADFGVKRGRLEMLQELLENK